MVITEAWQQLGLWVHDLDPVVFPLFGELKVRWYGLAYLGGFLAGYLLLRWMARRKLWVLEPGMAGDFIAYCALFGVFLGGRIGYVLFYLLPEEGFGPLREDPLLVFKVWKGGMASHGGILGLVIFTYVYARMKKVSWTGLGDGLCVVAPLGLMFGRLANFINGELYGRVAAGAAWAVKFPKAALTPGTTEHARQEEALRAATQVDPEVYPGNLVERMRGSEAVEQAVAPFLEGRYPSQLYQAALEGGLLFAILFFLRVRFPELRHGVLTGLFFVLYALFRITGERFRMPDAAWVVEGWVTKGQFYSFFMIAMGAAFLICAWKKGGRESAPAAG
ncbi:MAG: prolipoprotein diacylglyceryl transferase [Akkermansiaceae bacterium]|nr:prolipoprotein diacylglyceryl transferase [Akkermansiaceae bacterium]